MATKKKIATKSTTAVDAKGRVTNVKAKRVSVKTPVVKAAPKAVPTPKVAQPAAPVKTDKLGRVTNQNPYGREKPVDYLEGFRAINPQRFGQPVAGINPVQPGLQNQAVPWGQQQFGQPVASINPVPTWDEAQRRQQQDWMQPAGQYNGAPEYKPPKLTNVKTQYKAPKSTW